MKKKKEDILNSALKLFFEKGFNETSIDEITRLAGISKGSFYTYFQSKEDLLSEVIKAAIEATRLGFVSLSKEEYLNPIMSLESFFQLNLDLARNYSSNILTLIREVSFAPIKVRTRVTESFSKVVEEELRKFITLIKGECSDADITVLLGTVIVFWMNLIFNKDVPSIKELSKKVWFGIGGKAL
ncbi:MAG: TetR/AcrR family transcriptional regulator [bacterium]